MNHLLFHTNDLNVNFPPRLSTKVHDNDANICFKLIYEVFDCSKISSTDLVMM